MSSLPVPDLPRASETSRAYTPTHDADAKRVDTGRTVLIRTAVPDDLRRTSRWHCSELGLGLFPRLGERFMRRWHGSFLTSPHGIALIAEVANAAGEEADPHADVRTPIGFLVGSTGGHAHVRHVLVRNRLTLGLAGLAAMTVRPAVAVQFARTRLPRYLSRVIHPRREASPPARLADGSVAAVARVAVLAAVVVDPGHRSHGAGVLLVNEFLSRATAAGATTAELVTSKEGGAASFYSRFGWAAIGEGMSRDGDELVRFQHTLGAEPRLDRGGMPCD